MPLFLFAYWPTRTLTESELSERSTVVRDWTLARLRAGTIRTVIVADDASQWVGTAPAVLPALPLAGVALVEAADPSAAAALAADFPGRRFGTAVEVRPVKTLAISPPQ